MNKKEKFFSGVLAAVVSVALLIPAAHGTLLYSLDNQIGEATIVSGDATELAKMEEFVSAWLGTPTTLTQELKLNGGDTPDLGFNVQSNGDGTWYINVAPDQPGYFLLKFGTGNTGLPDHYFFQNIGELDKLVFSNEQVNFLSGGSDIKGTNIGKLSHYTTYNGEGGNPPSRIPEPASLLLMSAGLVGFGFARRRRSA